MPVIEGGNAVIVWNFMCTAGLYRELVYTCTRTDTE